MLALRMSGWLLVLGAAVGGALVVGLWADGSLRVEAAREADISIRAMRDPARWEPERPLVVASYLGKHLSLGAAYTAAPLALGVVCLVVARRRVGTPTAMAA